MKNVKLLQFINVEIGNSAIQFDLSKVVEAACGKRETFGSIWKSQFAEYIKQRRQRTVAKAQSEIRVSKQSLKRRSVDGWKVSVHKTVRRRKRIIHDTRIRRKERFKLTRRPKHTYFYHRHLYTLRKFHTPHRSLSCYLLCFIHSMCIYILVSLHQTTSFILNFIFNIFHVFPSAAKAKKGIRSISLQIDPAWVRRGESVQLFCNYDMESSPLYSVKWYRGTLEFYRYSPFEK